MGVSGHPILAAWLFWKSTGALQILCSSQITLFLMFATMDNDCTDLPALVAISDDEVEIRPDGMDQEKSVDKEFRLHRGATWTGEVT